MEIYNNSKKTFFYLTGLILTCVGLIYTHQAKASMLFAEAAQESAQEGQLVTLDWYLNTEGQSINSLILRINYTPQTLTLIEASEGPSLISLWINKPALIEPGLIELSGGVPGGIQSQRVPIFRTVFKAASEGAAKIYLASSSQVLLNDGQGSQDSLVFAPINFQISEALPQELKIISPTHPSESAWYSKTRVEFLLEGKKDQVLSFSFSSNIEESPDEIKDEAASPLVFENLADGTYYFKLAKQNDAGQWVGAGIFKVQIDQTPPENFEALVSKDSSLFGGHAFVSFFAVDKASGLDKYFIKNLWGRETQIESPYVFPKPWFIGNFKIYAKDRAGNIRETLVKVGPFVPKPVSLALLFVFVVLYIYWIISRRNKK